MLYTESSINNAINIGRDHIDNFQLESNEGTKRTKDKFRTLAISQRNNYVKKQMEDFGDLKLKLIDEITERYNRLLPEDKTAQGNSMESNVNSLFELVNLNSNMSDSFKLGIDYLLARLSNETSLEEFNAILNEFITKFREYGIELTVNDFKYTMFTEKYMDEFFKHANFDELKYVFEKIYFTCPDIKLQMKMNLSFIISKYSNKLSNVVNKLIEEKNKEFNVDKNTYMQKYLDTRVEYGSFIEKDEYNNAKKFLENKYKVDDFLDSSPLKNKNFELFVEDNFGELDDILKDRYNNALLDLYLTLGELKKYYSYEFIITDLLERYKKREDAKKSVVEKKKEIDKAEKERIKHYHEYLRATGKGLFAVKNEAKKNDAMLKINETVKKLNTLNDEYKDLTLTNNLNTLNESCTIYDLFMLTLTSFTFLEKVFTSNEEFVGDLKYIIHEYLRFLYNPVNAFIRKVNALVDFNISNIITEKFKILDLTIDDTMITKDTIDATLDSLRTINLIQNVDKSSISFEQIKVLCDMDQIISSNKVE